MIDDYTKIYDKLDNIINNNKSNAISFLQKLVQTKSVNPFTPEKSRPDSPIELEVAKIIYEELKSIGLTPHYTSLNQNRPNVVSEIIGKGSKTLILNGHMDTIVPPDGYISDPFSGEISDGKLYGVGSADMKASLAVFIFATRAIIESGIDLTGKLILSFVVDEESGACSKYGTQYLLSQGIMGNAAIVGEPGNKNICIGHRGGLRFKIKTIGKAQHTGLKLWERKIDGHNAINDMAIIIQKLSNLSIPYTDSPAFINRIPVLTFPTLIKGGTSINTVPDECTAYGDCRLLPCNSKNQIVSLIKQKLQEIKGVNYELEELIYVPAVEINPDEEIVNLLSRHTRDLTGKTPTTIGAGPWNDGWMFINKGIPTVCGFGVNGKNVHAPNEYIYLDSYFETIRIYARTIVEYLGICN